MSSKRGKGVKRGGSSKSPSSVSPSTSSSSSTSSTSSSSLSSSTSSLTSSLNSTTSSATSSSIIESSSSPTSSAAASTVESSTVPSTATDAAAPDSTATPALSSFDASNFHPLENEWTLWYDQRPLAGMRARGERNHYENNLHEIGTFATVEDFWRYFNHVVPPTRMQLNSNYHFFKKGIKPIWEDSQNKRGGKWIIIGMKGVKERDLIDRLWLDLLLALIGEALDSDDEICGAVMSRRKAGDKIALWNRNSDDGDAIMHIGQQMRKILRIDPKISLTYQSHADAIRSGASFTNPDRYRC